MFRPRQFHSNANAVGKRFCHVKNENPLKKSLDLFCFPSLHDENKNNPARSRTYIFYVFVFS